MNRHNLILPPLLTNSMDHYPEPYAVKDLEGRYIYGNPAVARLMRLKSVHCFIGKFDSEIKSKLTENEEAAKEWNGQCHRVASSRKKIHALELHPHAVNLPYITTLLPLIDEQNVVVGTALYVKSLDVFTLSDFIKGRRPGSLLLSKPSDFFTEKECEIIFLKLQGMTGKEIATLLCLSPRTIECRLRNMYHKCGVSHYDDFREFCEKENFSRYLPGRFLSQKKITFQFQQELNGDDLWEW